MLPILPLLEKKNLTVRYHGGNTHLKLIVTTFNVRNVRPPVQNKHTISVALQSSHISRIQNFHTCELPLKLRFLL